VKRLFAFGALVVALAAKMIITTTSLGEFIAVAAAFGACAGLIYLLNVCYRVAWTEAELSVSNGNLMALVFPNRRTWESVRFSSIRDIRGIAGLGLPPVNALVPFGILEIDAPAAQSEAIQLYPRVLNEIDLHALLLHIEAVRPGVLPDEVVARL